MYKQKRSAEEIQAIRNDNLKMMEKYPGRCVVFVEKLNKNKKDLPNIEKQKFLVPDEYQFSAFCLTIRKHIKLNPTDAIFYFVGTDKKQYLPAMTHNIGELYAQHKDEEDLRLYIRYDTENVFG